MLGPFELLSVALGAWVDSSFYCSSKYSKTEFSQELTILPEEVHQQKRHPLTTESNDHSAELC